jgi:methionine synthase II (cobalamin-independent)
LPFLKAHPHLSLFLASYATNLDVYDRLAYEFDLFGPFTADIVIGDGATKSYFLQEAGVETRNEILRCIEEAVEYLPLEQLALSPQCGFASGIEGNVLDEAAQRQKLELVADVAREVWTSG